MWVSVLAAPAAAQLSPEEEVGRRIFFEGSGAGEPIHAYFGRDSVRMPAILMPCANCHGHDGHGRPEGGVEPPNITWGHLTKSYGHTHPNGRMHGPFTEDDVAGAVIGGFDPDGNMLDPLMPRYEMEEADIKALVAFLKRLESTRDPGLSETAIRIGTLLPKAGAYGAVGAAMAETYRAYFEDLNAGGGVFGRKLELVVAEFSGDPAQTAAAARRLVEEDGGVFAVLGAFALGVEHEVFPVFADAGVPLIDPFTLFAGHRDLSGERTFFMLAGLPDQARALIEYSSKHVAPPAGSMAVILPRAEIYDELARALEEQARQNGRAAPAVLRLDGSPGGISQAATELTQAGTEEVYFFGDTNVLGRLAATGAARGWVPRLFLSGQTAGRAVFGFPKAFDGRIHLAYPNLPEDQSIEGREEFRVLRAGHGIGSQHLASQVRALGAAKLLVSALRHAGRTLSRATLVTQLEGLVKYDTGLLPPVTFASNRRVGVRGAHVLTVDLESGRFSPEEVWIDVD